MILKLNPYLQSIVDAPSFKNSARRLEFASWSSMISRCYSRGNASYRYYGRRGIKVCPRWRNSFKAFLEDVGKRPSIDFCIDRIDSKKDYEPGNCRWILKTENISRAHRHAKINLDIQTQEK